MTGPVRLCDLGGIGVLVTRPAHQADALCTWIEANGGHAIRFPAIDIVALDDREARTRLAGATACDHLIFISANAVRCALPMLPGSRDLRVAAVGRATARALADAGFDDILMPDAADSEGLLALGPMRHVAGANILIVRGAGGRELLGDTLARRGARVEYAEVYRRALPTTDSHDLLKEWDQGVQAITATSGEMVENLLRLLDADARVLDTPLITAGARVARLAESRGFRRVIAADGAHEHALVEALCRLVSTAYRG